MQKYILLLILFFPSLTFGQSYAGSYRAVFFNLFSEPKMIVVEFEIRADNSLNGKIKIDAATAKTFSGITDKHGKFEAVIEQTENFTYRLKGKFDKNNKISLVQRNQTGSGLNKSVSENALEGKFSKIEATVITPASEAQPKVELSDNGKSWLKIEHLNPIFGKDWTNFTATVGFSNSKKTPVGSEARKVVGNADASDYFVVRAKSKIDGEQTLSLSVALKTDDKRIWRQNELRVFSSYREVSGEQRNTFLASGATIQGDPRYADGELEIIRENETQIVFKLTNFKIKRLAKDDFVLINGFIYANK